MAAAGAGPLQLSDTPIWGRASEKGPRPLQGILGVEVPLAEGFRQDLRFVHGQAQPLADRQPGAPDGEGRVAVDQLGQLPGPGP